MDSEPTSPDPKDLLRKYEKKQIESINKRAADRQAIEHQLRTEERFKNYFENYHPVSVESFIKDYATKKAMWLEFSEGIIRRQEAAELQWVNAAGEHLKYIQQKKLFDQQCLWRADKTKLEGIEICFDFQLWERDIMNCPCIEPVSEEDVDLYVQYLQQHNVDLRMGMFFSWQRYHDIKEAYASDNNGRSNFPEWYDFYNGRRGTGVYMTLPDLRGEKEDFYIKLCREQNREETKARMEEHERTRDKRPFLKSTYDKQQMNFFVSTFEDKQTLAYYKAWEYNHRNSGVEEQLSVTIDLLLSADEPVPVKGNADFKEALFEAADRYRQQQVAAHLPLAFEQYQLNQGMGIAAYGEDTNARMDYMKLREGWYGDIVKGRVLNGEPADVNF